MKPETALLNMIKDLENVLEQSRLILVTICPHEKYTTHSDPTAHSCDLCGVYLETDSLDGTGKVLTPHRPWTGGEIE